MPGQPPDGSTEKWCECVGGLDHSEQSVCVRMCVCVAAQLLSRVWLSMDFSRQGYWSGCRFLLWGIFPYPGIEPVSSVSCIGWQILYHCATFRIEEQNTFHKCIFSAQLFTAAPWRSAVFKFGDSWVLLLQLNSLAHQLLPPLCSVSILPLHHLEIHLFSDGSFLGCSLYWCVILHFKTFSWVLFLRGSQEKGECAGVSILT